MSVNRPVNRLLTIPVDRFFTEGFCSLFNVLMKNFQKGGAWVRYVLKFVTPNESLRKKRKNSFLVLAKITKILFLHSSLIVT